MPDVKGRWSTFRFHVIDVGNARPFARRSEERGLVVNRLAESVRTLDKDATGPLIPRREHHAVVVRVAATHAGGDRGEERVREKLFVWGLVTAKSRIADNDARLVLIDKRSQLVTSRSLVVHLQRKIPADPPLDAEIVLIDVSASQIWIFGVETEQTTCRRTRTLSAEVRDQRYGLIESISPREFSGLSHVFPLLGSKRVRSIQAHVRRNIVEDFVIAHAEAKTNHRVVVTEQRSRESRCVCKAKNRGEVVFIGIHA